MSLQKKGSRPSEASGGRRPGQPTLVDAVTGYPCHPDRSHSLTLRSSLTSDRILNSRLRARSFHVTHTNDEPSKPNSRVPLTTRSSSQRWWPSTYAGYVPAGSLFSFSSVWGWCGSEDSRTPTQDRAGEFYGNRGLLRLKICYKTSFRQCLF